MSYVAAGYSVTAVVLVSYVSWVLRRRRSLERRLAPAPTPSAPSAS